MIKNLRAIRRALYITTPLNLVTMLAKLLVGYWPGATAHDVQRRLCAQIPAIHDIVPRPYRVVIHTEPSGAVG